MLEAAIIFACVGAVAMLSLLVRALHLQERGADRRHREWMDLQRQSASVPYAAANAAPQVSSFPEIPDLPAPPSAPISVLTPPRSDDEDENRTEIFAGPSSRRPAGVLLGDGPASTRTLATGTARSR